MRRPDLATCDRTRHAERTAVTYPGCCPPFASGPHSGQPGRASVVHQATGEGAISNRHDAEGWGGAPPAALKSFGGAAGAAARTPACTTPGAPPPPAAWCCLLRPVNLCHPPSVQGVSVLDLSNRLRSLETTFQQELKSLWPLRVRWAAVRPQRGAGLQPTDSPRGCSHWLRALTLYQAQHKWQGAG